MLGVMLKISSSKVATPNEIVGFDEKAQGRVGEWSRNGVETAKHRLHLVNMIISN